MTCSTLSCSSVPMRAIIVVASSSSVLRWVNKKSYCDKIQLWRILQTFSGRRQLSAWAAKGQVRDESVPSQHRLGGQRLLEHSAWGLEARADDQLDSVWTSVLVLGEYQPYLLLLESTLITRIHCTFCRNPTPKIRSTKRRPKCFNRIAKCLSTMWTRRCVEAILVMFILTIAWTRTDVICKRMRRRASQVSTSITVSISSFCWLVDTTLSTSKNTTLVDLMETLVMIWILSKYTRATT